MPMRYLIRPAKPEDLSDLRKKVPDVDQKLGQAKEGLLRRAVTVEYSPVNFAHYQVEPRKQGADWIWVNPCIEFDVENEAALFEMCDRFQVPRPAHLVGAPAQKA